MKLLHLIHERFVRLRRLLVLKNHILPLLPHGATVLDVGAGNGALAQLLLKERPDLRIKGIDILLYGSPIIEIEKFDGRTIPFPDKSFDVVMFIDVLHHTDDPFFLLREAIRTSKRSILIKDHLQEGWMSDETLRFMDWVGNARHSVNLPYNFWTEKYWAEIQNEMKLKRKQWSKDLRIYPWPFTWVFDRSLHFLGLFDIQ